MKKIMEALSGEPGFLYSQHGSAEKFLCVAEPWWAVNLARELDHRSLDGEESLQKVCQALFGPSVADGLDTHVYLKSRRLTAHNLRRCTGFGKILRFR